MRGTEDEEEVTREGEEEVRGGRKGMGKYIGQEGEEGKGRGGKSRPHGHF